MQEASSHARSEQPCEKQTRSTQPCEKQAGVQEASRDARSEQSCDARSEQRFRDVTRSEERCERARSDAIEASSDTQQAARQEVTPVMREAKRLVSRERSIQWFGTGDLRSDQRGGV